MKNRDQLHACFILHTRPYRESSVLLEVFTETQGRVSLLARGMRGNSRRSRSSLLQPFIPLEISYYGRHELMTLKQVEALAFYPPLSGDRIYAGLYVNELIMRLTERFDPHPNIFMAYRALLLNLAAEGDFNFALRLFEKRLLSLLGYALPLAYEAGTGAEINPEHAYLFDPEEGPRRLAQRSDSAIMGCDIIALSQEKLTTPESLIAAKRVLHTAFTRILGGKPLQSRQCFKRYHYDANEIT